MSETREQSARARIGLAIGPRAIWAARVGRLATASTSEQSSVVELEDISRASIERAFRTVQTQLGAPAAVLDVALLPRLVQARDLRLPRLGLNEVRRVMAHAATKYFFAAREPQTVGARRTGKGRESPMRVFTVASPTFLIELLFEVAHEIGWQVDSVQSAYDVWAEAARSSFPRNRRPTWLVHAGPDVLEGIELQNGMPALVRRAAGGTAAAVASKWIGNRMTEAPGKQSGEPVRVAVIGREVDVAGVRSELAAAHVETVEFPHGDGCDPGHLAARWVERTAGTELIPNPVRERRVTRARRVTLALGAAAAVFVAMAASAELWGARRQLRALEQERTSIRAEVEAAVAEREVLLELTGRLNTLSTAETTAPRWSNVLASVAQHLPEDAHLLAFRASADSLFLEGLADRAAGVFEAMQAAPDILGVRARAPIRRELLSGNRAIERFALGAQLGGAAPTEEPQ